MGYIFGGGVLGAGDDGNENPPGTEGDEGNENPPGTDGNVILGVGAIVDDACIDTEVLENVTDVSMPCDCE